MFESQVVACTRGAGQSPSLRIGTHSDLLRIMSRTWLRDMANWIEPANSRFLDGIANRSIKFKVTRIGSVMTEVLLNGKNTRVVLYLHDHSQPRDWQIVLEPIANVPDEPFWSPHQ